MKFYFTLILLIFACSLPALSQELQADITVNAPQKTTVDPSVFQSMESSIAEFINNRKWTKDKYSSTERIQCSFGINIIEELSTESFKAEVTIQSSRPVFMSSYNTVLLSYMDKKWTFTYSEYLPLEFNENVFLNNLSSLIAYYCYLILGFDYDSFEQKGGEPYLRVAQKIVSSAQNAQSPGWKSTEKDINRHDIISSTVDPKFAGFRNAMYDYHRIGLDLMHENVEEGRQGIMKALEGLMEVRRSEPNSILLQLFFNAKSNEIIGIFKEAPQEEKSKAVQLLTRLNPTNSGKYEEILHR